VVSSSLSDLPLEGMKQDTGTSNAAGAWGGVLAITTLACRAQANGANSLAVSVRVLGCHLLAVLIFLTGCAQETLFQSNFDQTPTGQPPSAAQAVGTANVDGPAGSVIVVTSPVTPSGKWVQISQPGEPQFVASLQGTFAQVRGDGTYTFSAILFIPSGNGPATIRFESQGVVSPDLPTVFLHLDIMPDNRVRIDDDPGTLFGTFPHDQIFIVQVTLNINASAATAHIVLSGAGASGQADYNIISALRPVARQFGAVRLMMGFPSTGKFDATTIVVTRKTQ
jgi:hypothetical protein